MAFECRLLGVVRLSIFGRFVFLESAISGRFVWDFSEIWICGLYKATKGGGQILVCVGGRGYYQEWGKEPVELFPGDAVYISAGVKHWHGAAPDSWFSHLAIEAPGENKSNEWLEPVSEEEYSGVVRHQR